MQTAPIAPPTPTTSRFSLRLLLVLSFSVLATLVVAIVISTLYIRYSRQMREELRQRAADLAAIAALQQNGDELVQIASEADPLYEKMRQQNQRIADISPEIAYVYTMRKDEQGIFFVVDVAGSKYEDTALFGERYPDASPVLLNNFDTMETAIADEEIYTDSFGSFLSGYAPIRNSQGEKVGVIGVDLSADAVIEREQRFLIHALGIFGLSLAVILLGGLLTGMRLAQPINLLTQSANRIAAGDFTHRVQLPPVSREVTELADDFNRMADAFQNLVATLERRVQERTEELQQRTQELEIKSRQAARRLNQFRAIAEVARSISAIENLQDLLPRIAAVISQEFGFYHTGIFLIDDDKEYAVLAASNSEGGQRMLKRGHQLKIGETSIVGFAALTGQARIALDTGEDAVYFNNPDLPTTRSEMAIPLRAGNQVIGVLDVQSEQVNAFSQEDIELLSIMADQVSIAIQNAQQFQATQRAAAEAQQAYRRYIRGEWRTLLRETGRMGYRYSKAGVGPLKARVQSLEIQEAEATGLTRVSTNETSKPLVVPIKLREEVLGVLSISASGGRLWDPDEVDIVEAVVERVALAIENLRLLETSRAQAMREQTISAVSARIASSVNLQSILQTAVEELGRILPGSEVVIQLGTANNQTERDVDR